MDTARADAGLRQWKPTFGEGRIRLRSILLRDYFWISARRRRGISENGCGCSSGNIEELT